MTMFSQIEKEKQLVARCEQSLALEQFKKRKADTRRKIELGGLIIKAGMDEHNKTVILGALIYAKRLTVEDNYRKFFEEMGANSF